MGRRHRHDRPRPAPDLATVVPLGLATGLVAATKMTGLFGAAPVLLVWGVVQLRRAPVRAVLAGVGVLALAGLVVGPFLARNNAEFGNVLGPAYLSDSVTMGSHTPAAIGVNALKIVQSLFDNPLTVGFAQGILTLARWLGVDPNDPATNFGPAFPQITWYPDEDRSSYPVQALLVLAGVVAALVRRAPARLYACCFLAAAVLHVSMIKWQMWGNRLTAYLLVLGGAARRAAARGALAAQGRPRRAVVAFALLLGLASVGYGWPRRLVGENSLLTLDEDQRRFSRRPWQADFEWAAHRVGGARVIGIAEDKRLVGVPVVGAAARAGAPGVAKPGAEPAGDPGGGDRGRGVHDRAGGQVRVLPAGRVVVRDPRDRDRDHAAGAVSGPRVTASRKCRRCRGGDAA
ncbi:hypothetical protein R8Z50_00025 [Longispora sp. K20-0274]|uniref:hypothetical protein n=1 Tax=Longispora sp. K20-0274 TaxID=3088255 RepID=UPI00399BCB62